VNKYANSHSTVRLQVISRDEYYRACRQADERKRRRARRDALTLVGLVVGAAVVFEALAFWMSR
jgi:hypothetical protein